MSTHVYRVFSASSLTASGVESSTFVGIAAKQSNQPQPVRLWNTGVQDKRPIAALALGPVQGLFDVGAAKFVLVAAAVEAAKIDAVTRFVQFPSLIARVDPNSFHGPMLARQ